VDVSVARLGPADGEHRGAGTGGVCLSTRLMQPQITSSTSAGSRPERLASLQDEGEEVSGVHVGEPAVAFADGVRTASTSTASRALPRTGFLQVWGESLHLRHR